MAGYIRVRRCDVSEDSFERTKGLANEQAQDQHTQMLVCKVVGIVKPQEPVYEPLEDTEPAPVPKRKVLDLTVEQDGTRVYLKVVYVDPVLMTHKATLASDGVFGIEVIPYSFTYLLADRLIVGGRDKHHMQAFDTEAAATDRITRITKLLAIINANEPLEEPEPPKPRRKVLDVELEQRDSTVMATVNHVDPKLVKEAMTLIHGGVQIRTDPDRYTAAFRDELIIGGKGGTSNTIFPSAADASSWIAEVHRLLAIINANEPQEGGEA
jgi:hypothetical protein